MRVRVYPEGDGRKAKAYDVQRKPVARAPLARLGSPAWTDAALAATARSYAEEEGAADGYEPIRLCVEPMDDEARALPGWHPAEPPTEYDDEAPRPFRLFVVTAKVEWSAREVQTFHPAAKQKEA